MVQVYNDLTSRYVLVSEWVEGQKLSSISKGGEVGVLWYSHLSYDNLIVVCIHITASTLALIVLKFPHPLGRPSRRTVRNWTRWWRCFLIVTSFSYSRQVSYTLIHTQVCPCLISRSTFSSGPCLPKHRCILLRLISWWMCFFHRREFPFDIYGTGLCVGLWAHD